MTQPNPRSFLGLPPTVRLAIYRAADVNTDERIYLKRWQSGYIPPPPHDQLALLLTCRLVYQELSRLVYSTNQFSLWPNHLAVDDLFFLTNLRPHTIPHLSHLTVNLNVRSDAPGVVVCEHLSRFSVPDDVIRPWVDRPIRKLSSLDRLYLSSWQAALRHVLNNVEPFTLTFYLQCDVENYEAAALTIAPLLEPHAPLADCAVRLSEQPDPALRLLAHTAATRSMGLQSRDLEKRRGRSNLAELADDRDLIYLNLPAQSAFESSPQELPSNENPKCHLLDLPEELRHAILGFSDLLTPLAEVTWDPKDKYYCWFPWRFCYPHPDLEDEYQGQNCTPYDHPACRFRFCYFECHRDGCFCARRHAAYYSKCRCWAPPPALFRVCRTLRDDAEALFLQSNRFVVVPPNGNRRAAKRTPPQIEPSLFLQQLRPSSLHHLRSLELVFPPFDFDYMRPDEPAYPDWLHTIDAVKDKLSLPMLTLRVTFADHWRTGFGVTQFRVGMTDAQARAVLAAYERAIAPLAELGRRGLKRFFADLAYPQGWHADAIDDEQSLWGTGATRDWFWKKMAPEEARLERLVMGPDYDAAAHGKFDGQRSEWWMEGVRMREYFGVTDVPADSDEEG